MWNRSENQVNLIFIRHGAAKWNQEHRYLGRTDEPLCAEGRDELRRRKAGNSYPDIECLFASPMKRCMQTAQILYPHKQPIVIAEWAEMDFGDFEGKNYMELQKDARYQEWIDSNGMLPFPNGEDRENFNRRCAQGFQKMMDILMQQMGESLERNRKDSGCGGRKAAGIIVHGGTIMSLFSRYGKGEYFDYQVPNGGGYLCSLEMGDDFCFKHIQAIPE